MSIPIFFTFDNNYVEPAAIAFYSLLNKVRAGIFYDMYVLHSNITNDNQSLLLNIVKQSQKGNLSFINVENFLETVWKEGNFEKTKAAEFFPPDSLVRCFSERFFRQYDKIIYSDVDVIFVDDISDLYEIDTNNKYMVGVKNPFARYLDCELSHLKSEHYEMLHDKCIAGGILVINLKKIREDNLEKKMLNIACDATIEKRWPDQDVINIACAGKVGFMPLNYISYPYLIDFLQDPKFISDYSREELFDSIINPKIIHFASEKPWNGNPKYANLWWTYFNYLGLKKTKIFSENTVKANEKLKKREKRNNILLALLICLTLLNVFARLLG